MLVRCVDSRSTCLEAGGCAATGRLVSNRRDVDRIVVGAVVAAVEVRRVDLHSIYLEAFLGGYAAIRRLAYNC